MGSEESGLLSFNSLCCCDIASPLGCGHRLAAVRSRSACWERLHVLLLLLAKSRWHYRELEVLISFCFAECRLEQLFCVPVYTLACPPSS